MNERENILGRIRKALSVPAPVPGATHGEQVEPPTEREAAACIPRWLPSVAGTLPEQIAQFQANAVELKAEFFLLDSAEAAAARLQEIAQAESWKSVAAHSHALVDGMVAGLPIPVLNTEGGYDVHAMEACDAGITACDALVVQTGSVLVTSQSAGGRALSVLPPHHVVVARRDQFVPDLTAAFELLKQKYATGYPSLISFITGPSRTGDIERILVLGAHGPKKLTILCF